MNSFLRLIKILILVAAGLLGAAGGYAGKPEFVNTQSTLSKAAYALFTIALVALSASFIGLYLNQIRVIPAHRLVSRHKNCINFDGRVVGLLTPVRSTSNGPWPRPSLSAFALHTASSVSLPLQGATSSSQTGARCLDPLRHLD